jgi:hypothetical protein
MTHTFVVELVVNGEVKRIRINAPNSNQAASTASNNEAAKPGVKEVRIVGKPSMVIG